MSKEQNETEVRDASELMRFVRPALEKHPHLFANRKFLAEATGGNSHIVGISISAFDEILIVLNDGDMRRTNQCTLIARPIADMSDEEITEYIKSTSQNAVGLQYQNQDFIDDLVERAEYGFIDRNAFIYLLSIGVYPFDQKAFETGEVIERSEA